MGLTFGAVCSLLQSIENITTRQPRLTPPHQKEGVRQVISNWLTHHRHQLDDPATDGAAVLSALLPRRRKDRVYGLRSPLLAKKLSRLLALNHAQRALFNGWTTGVHGDLGAYVERAMRPWDGTFSTKHAIPVDRVDNLLVQLAARHRCSNAAIRRLQDRNLDTDTELRDILVRLESWEAKWLVRLILRDYCTIELDEHHLLQHYHFLLPDLLMFQDDFDAVFNMLRGDLKCFPSAPSVTEEPGMRVEAAQRLKPIVGVKVGRPRFLKAWVSVTTTTGFRQQLINQSFKHGFQLVGNQAWAAEVKYDGGEFISA
jgi:DNA ligase-4